MALKKGQPAIRAEWVWGWIYRGTLPTVTIPGTGDLLVVKNARPQTTYGVTTPFAADYWVEPVRYRLPAGRVLVARWDPLLEHFDPIRDANSGVLSKEQLGARGMIRLEDGTVLVLIYMLDEDLLHYQRQQEHIDQAYAQELDLIRPQLTALENQAPKLAQELAQVRPDRQEAIGAILEHITARGNVARQLLAKLGKEVATLRYTVWTILISPRLEEPVPAEVVDNVGDPIRTYRRGLRGVYRRLGNIRILPITTPIQLAQSRLIRALGNLDVWEIETAREHLRQALVHLDKALELLGQPKPTAH